MPCLVSQSSSHCQSVLLLNFLRIGFVACYKIDVRVSVSCGQISVAGAGTGVIKSRQAGLSGAGLYNADVQCFNCSLWPCAGLRTRQLIDWPESRRLELQLQVVLVAQSQPEPRSTFPCSPFLVTTNQPLTKSLFYLVTTTLPLTKSLCSPFLVTTTNH